MAKGTFTAADPVPCGKDGVSKKIDAAAYEVIMDTKGTLQWPDDTGSERPLVIAMSQQAPQEYLDYLDSRNISWIVCEEKTIDLEETCRILHDTFGVRRMAVVGGGHINGGFLEAGLLDEVSMVIGPGIDGREGMTAAFDGLPADHAPTQLKLENTKVWDNGAVWLRYKVLS